MSKPQKIDQWGDQGLDDEIIKVPMWVVCGWMDGGGSWQGKVGIGEKNFLLLDYPLSTILYGPALYELGR